MMLLYFNCYIKEGPLMFLFLSCCCIEGSPLMFFSTKGPEGPIEFNSESYLPPL